MKIAYFKSPIGWIELKGDASGLGSVIFIDSEISSEENNREKLPNSLQKTIEQLTEYFEGNRQTFDIPLSPQGTEFQKKVWRELQEIPFGKTTSYQKMANALGDPKVIRAAASANGKNPISIIIPCHRVIGTDGSLTGYAGGLQRKKWLLQHESPVKQGELF
ncbi:methylated-DNA--[protein]-cysteine S-methyltransferase [Marixanthomonas ophiurae]|uniref:Methylated-DNA--protein-cysteine methyltransferase n=1 Tax=Marixanthomonas ophiurae TaxID=387659 RepID=A0A3E1QAH9_9FLAO|nr:methylated-DNA--[protein]-cysteine S-methyltransferase [Marixanthomonas ophiurae]RFN59127.1 methylated-DNA--[protein]-cysteine S-methyltransferase [Marixanthomonas ophiurae]